MHSGTMNNTLNVNQLSHF